jgi:hypothetical protein
MRAEKRKEQGIIKGVMEHPLTLHHERLHHVEERPFQGRVKQVESKWALAPEGLDESAR